jgi:hypothetical protein
MAIHIARPALGGLGATVDPSRFFALKEQTIRRISPTPPPPPVPLSAAANGALAALEQLTTRARERLSGGSVAELDTKTPCDAGTWADDVSKGKSNELDPNHCLSYGGPWISPMIEIPVDCANAGQLLWADLADQTHAQLRTLLANRPANNATGEDQYRWFRGVLSACSLIGVSSNVNPRDFTVSLDPQPDDKKPFGKYQIFAEAMNEINGLHKRVVSAINSRGATYVAVPVVCPTYLAIADEFARAETARGPYSGPQTQLGWNDERTYAGGLYRKLLALEGRSLFDFDGFRGVNAGQVTVWGFGGFGGIYVWPDTAFDFKVSNSTKTAGSDPYGRGRTGNFFGRGFAMPYASMDPAAESSNELAGSILRTNTTTREAEGRMLQIFSTTAGNPGHMVRGFFLSRTYLVGGAPPLPAQMAEHYQQCWAPTARYYMDLAEIWGRAFLRVNILERIGSALKSYGFRIKRLIATLGARGVDITLGTVASVEDMIKAANEIRTGAYTAVAGGISSVVTLMASAGLFAGSGGPITLAITLVVIVVAALVMAFIELLKWNQSPREERGEDDWSLVLDTFFLRSPPLSSACAANPEIGLDVMDKGYNADRGYGSPFARIAAGLNPIEQVASAASGADSGDGATGGFPVGTLLLVGGAVALVAFAARR